MICPWWVSIEPGKGRFLEVHEIERIEDWWGVEVVGSDGERIGKLEDLLYDASSGKATFIVVKSGRISIHRMVVPLVGAVIGRDRIRLAFPAEQISGAPALEDDTVMRRRDELAMASYYGFSAPTSSASDEAMRYESATFIEQRRAATDEVLRRAAELEALADRKRQESEVEAESASTAQQNAASADADRQRLLEEVARLRASVARNQT
jgi:sporulation protein YlmC with PRC-barrel domain